MYHFFVEPEQIQDKEIIITGSDVNHIKNVIRLKVGDEISISNGIDGRDYRCGIAQITEDEVRCELRFIKEDGVELPVKVCLFQGLPKGDKMELIVQKMVELGVYEIVPVTMKRCVMKLDDKKAKNKIARWQGIAEAASKQSKRGIVPQIHEVMTYKEALAYAKTMQHQLVPYEMEESLEGASGMAGTRAAIEAVEMRFNMQNEVLRRIQDNVAKVMIGKEEVTKLLLAPLAAGGHVLLEDVPGTGKTVLAKTLAKSMGCQFDRVQFTPDLLPTDVTGLSFFNQEKGCFTFKEGPVFTNVLLADEINRATPRTQSSLLECMAERQVTVDGVTRALSAPFFVIATQNPIETIGCFPLPEAQLDRFIMKLYMGSLDAQQEIQMLERFMDAQPLAQIEPVTNAEEIAQLQEECCHVYVHPDLIEYMVNLVQATSL